MQKQQKNLAFLINKLETTLSNTRKKVWTVFKIGEEKESQRKKWTN